MRQREGLFKDRVLGDLNRLPLTFAEKIQQQALRGTPDIFICMNGHFIALELKKDGKARLDPLQAYKLRCIAEANGHSYLAYPEIWSALLDELCKKFLPGIPLGPESTAH